MLNQVQELHDKMELSILSVRVVYKKREIDKVLI